MFNKSGNRYVAMDISFEMDLKLSENVTSKIVTKINSYLSNTTSTLEVVGFQPSSKCLLYTTVCEHIICIHMYTYMYVHTYIDIYVHGSNVCMIHSTIMK